MSLECSACSAQDLSALKAYGYIGAISHSANLVNNDFVVATRRTISLETNASFHDLLQAIYNARREVDVVALSGDNDYILKRLTDTNKTSKCLFDVFVLNLETCVTLRPATIQALIRNQQIVLEIDISQLLQVKANRAKLLSNARHAVRSLVRRRNGKLRLILSGGGVRDVEEVCAIAALFGLQEQDIREAMGINAQELVREAKRRRTLFLAQPTTARSGGGGFATGPALTSLKQPKKRASTAVDEDQRKRMLLVNAWV